MNEDMIKIGQVERSNVCGSIWDEKGRDQVGEFLTSTSVSYGALSMYDNPTKVLKTMKFSTNKSSYGPFGKSSLDAKHFNFHVGNPRLFAGFHGSINSFGVESIGVYVKSNISSIVNPKVPSVKSEKEEDNK
ncbi:hypothetical protein CQW23_22530 [Capsicum baccatum]|uniref:Jacalin-type lectin domain-containing protein n=1 Tax=Capsicum baccatum TaxID=33114 RepID=A0A2G2W143_CAPBA|nr:hypothetical protein CQW23_22530 [Capsicum baccatum]